METNLAVLLPEKHILWISESHSKKRIFEKIAIMFENTSGLSRDKTFRMLIDRERLGATSIGNGGAIPHGRLNDIESPLCALMRLQKPMPYGAVSEEENVVQTLFFLITPQGADKIHLVLLSTFAEILSNEDFMQSLGECADATAAHAKIKEWADSHPLQFQ